MYINYWCSVFKFTQEVLYLKSEPYLLEYFRTLTNISKTNDGNLIQLELCKVLSTAIWPQPNIKIKLQTIYLFILLIKSTILFQECTAITT